MKAEDLGGFIFKDTEIPSIFIAIAFLSGDCWGTFRKYLDKWVPNKFLEWIVRIGAALHIIKVSSWGWQKSFHVPSNTCSCILFLKVH